MIQAANLGFPRIGIKRELKKATESYWKGEIDYTVLRQVGAELRARHWHLQKDAGIDIIPSNDFSFYDQMLDTAAMVGAVPPRFQPPQDGIRVVSTHQTASAYAVMADVAELSANDAATVDFDTYFAMARGSDAAPAMEMTKWFDTNYHYIVPEFHEGQTFRLASTKALDEFSEAKALGIHTRPVLIGPVTFLSLGKAKDANLDPLSLLDALLPIYAEVLASLAAAGADWVQIDEPILALDLNDRQKAAFKTAYAALSSAGVKILIATYFDELGRNLDIVRPLPVDGLHADLVRAPQQLDAVLKAWPWERVLSLGVIDGRNIWRADLEKAFATIGTAIAARGKGGVQIAPSCSLIHTPVDLDAEQKLDAELKSWLAYARQKLTEVAALKTAATNCKDAVAWAFEESAAAVASRAGSARINNPAVKARADAVSEKDLDRGASFKERQAQQRERLNLPAFPTTTIGSFPQTEAVRKARAAFKRGEMDAPSYDAFLMTATEDAVRKQEELGIDVLVHGEFERNDMVEYFGEQLSGFAFTQSGWVQSYGSRYVKPPIIFGDVSRPHPMTVAWSSYAQSLTKKPMKGMLTGPVTILQWSFVRDDQPRSETCKQIALAIRDEVSDLERAGIPIIQIDEPALREGLPLRHSDWEVYLAWAVDCFRLAAAGAGPETQIHTHMCYCEFNDIMPSIAALDADVISIETSRSDMELLESFSDFKYPNEIGPGVYDIHSPRCPHTHDMSALLGKAREHLAPDQIWVNPDCGLKTRRWEEVLPALKNMVAAAREARGS
ncbi:5-methyltetrahydropteroyltriglutamate--homocysteine S-methyltransferase [Hyphomicrobium sp.]|uniref:5-methyltetrahydropteroyltriglutamate-- homocysteine S-methyltransferase n=1 Tax=Hyphomicrobium sp. TaxID=82 RepID=UPI002BA667EF|nr:5-methyltetrahydropteroyltriglutamate--homocysteine S-methyltransferase [Hyphomicrobium sp.]HRN88589.1 5-methyltetrahydropteroyltriglutamate--homocysteine S-methyltransferase [Hyphomicrobium sp.]HRQ27154.1 5-methyltetrahydropteroyltriglutamate--homocysteine S-methyltransferase [Hyphomicrobium sp.]